MPHGFTTAGAQSTLTIIGKNEILTKTTTKAKRWAEKIEMMKNAK
ncbi:MAG: hypothetical protein ABIN01_11915 [Ferruginibacter sp.]